MPIPNKKPQAIALIKTYLEGKDPSLFPDGLFLPPVGTAANLTVFIPWQAWTLQELIEMPRRIEEGLGEGFVTAQSRLLESGCPSVFGLELDEDLAVLQYFGYKHGMEVTLALYKERVAAEYYEKQDELRRRRRRRPEGE